MTTPPLPPPPLAEDTPGMGESFYAPDSNARNWAMAIHLSALLGWLGNGVLWVAAPLVLWLLKRNESPFIDDQGKEAVNFHLSLIIWGALGFVVCLPLFFIVVGVFIFVLLVGVLFVVQVVFSVLAAISASSGQPYRYPLTLRLVK